jgi:hypothetical protein
MDEESSSDHSSGCPYRTDSPDGACQIFVWRVSIEVKVNAEILDRRPQGAADVAVFNSV